MVRGVPYQSYPQVLGRGAGDQLNTLKVVLVADGRQVRVMLPAVPLSVGPALPLVNVDVLGKRCGQAQQEQEAAGGLLHRCLVV